MAVEARLLVDWNGDWFIAENSVPGQPLNLIPNALYMPGHQFYMSPVLNYSRKSVTTAYGIMAVEATMGSGATMAAGKDELDASVDFIPASASTQYTWSLYVKGISVYAGHDVTLTVKNQAGTTVGTSSALSLSSGWQQISVTATTPGGTTYITMELTKSATAGSTVLQTTGWMMVAGASVTQYNTGDASDPYNDITSYALQVQHEKRMNQPVHTPIEGTLVVQLDNSDRIFSPEYSSSPLYGKMKDQRRIVFQIKNPADSTWYTMWQGWIRSYEITAGGTTGDLKATITAEQGLFKISTTPLQIPVQTNVSLNTILDQLILNGWYSPDTPYICVLDEGYLDKSTWMVDINLMRTADTAITVFPLVGDQWEDNKTSPETALSDLIEIEGGYLRIERNGNLTFTSRNTNREGVTPTYTISINTDANGGKYQYGGRLINNVAAGYSPINTITNVTVWQTRKQLELKAGETRKPKVKFQYEEGKKTTVKNVYGFTGSPASAVTVTDKNGNAIAANLFDISFTMGNGEGRLRIKNRTKSKALFTVTLKGDIEMSNNDESIEVSDVTDYGPKRYTISNKLLRTENDARNLADWMISQYKTPVGEFTSITIRSRDDNWITRIINLQPGFVISLTEYQTGVTDKLALIIGENFLWRPQFLEVEFLLDRVDPNQYWQVGSGALGTSTVIGY